MGRGVDQVLYELEQPGFKAIVTIIRSNREAIQGFLIFQRRLGAHNQRSEPTLLEGEELDGGVLSAQPQCWKASSEAKRSN
jgi:hypothetical protein